MELSEEAKESRRQYNREWRKKNPGYDKKWREDNKDSVKVSQRRYRRNNKARSNAYQREWNKRNPEKRRQYDANKWERKAAKENTVTESVTPITVTSIEKPGQKICINCESFFEAKRSTARYCSDKCRVQYNRKMKR